MKISVASYSFHGLHHQGAMDVFGYLESCRYRYCLDAADIWNGFFPTVEEDFLKKVKEGLEQRELALANLCVDGPHLWVDDPDLREKNYQNMLAYMHAAEVLGAQTVRIDAGGREETWTEEQFDFIVNRFREYAQRAYDNGYKIGPENHWGPEVKPDTMKALCEAVDHPGFGVLLHFRGDPGEVLFAPYAMHTHISWDISERCLDESLNMLRSHGFLGYYSVEHHSGENEYNEVAIQVARVRDVLCRWMYEN